MSPGHLFAHCRVPLFRVPSEQQKSRYPKGYLLFWCERWDSNPHGVDHTHLKRACLPFQHSRKCPNIIPRQVHFVNRIFLDVRSEVLGYHKYEIGRKNQTFTQMIFLTTELPSSRTIATILQVFEGSYIILILFATLFYLFSFVFSTFYFSLLRQNPHFSNFLGYVMHSIHKFFHRF